MSAIPSIQDNPNGLHARYKVTKLNGEPTDHLATYFVLRIDSHGRDGLHIAASRAAARAYSDFITSQGRSHLSKVGEQLRIVVDNLERDGG